ncbi:thaumatin-like protein 1 [Dendrobium catenatum]|uniref:Thaumatin-like protein n=1 Tax=Dendrobium catenatum TaxID=906689 RepID=A0A2I0WQC4_9ASPA|nr:thaumatin-like protein 1 [Dendrobium catenatum]PKU77860.1 hypothetical protein MA16_Dca005692 [Dendrobium catenatum]
MASHGLISFFSSSLFLHLLLPITNAFTLEIINNCPYTVWAAALPGGGRQLNPSQNWTFSIASNTDNCRVWGRTNCEFKDGGVGRCETGDCGGRLECSTLGKAPYTGAGFTLNNTDGMDYYHLSLTKGFNVPMSLSPDNLSSKCKALQCSADIIGQCPAPLKAPGGCNDPCTVFRNEKECCTTAASCSKTPYNEFFKHLCPQAWSYPKDNSTITCPAGTKFRVTFCPI